MTIVLQMNHAKTCLTPIILYLILTKMCMRMWCRQEQVTEKTRIHNRCVELSHIKMTTRNEWKRSASGDKKRQRILRCSVFSSFLNYSESKKRKKNTTWAHSSGCRRWKRKFFFNALILINLPFIFGATDSTEYIHVHNVLMLTLTSLLVELHCCRVVYLIVIIMSSN